MVRPAFECSKLCFVCVVADQHKSPCDTHSAPTPSIQASLLCLLALALTESHLPRLYLALSLALNLVHSINISSSAPQSPTSSSWSIVTAKAALFFLAPITAHFSLLSHVSTLHRSWHTRRSRPLLAGGRLDWDLHDVAAMAGAATTRAEYTTTEVLALLFVGPWGTTILSWLETVAAARWVQRSGSGSWLLPTSVPTGRDDKQRVA